MRLAPGERPRCCGFPGVFFYLMSSISLWLHVDNKHMSTYENDHSAGLFYLLLSSCAFLFCLVSADFERKLHAFAGS